MKKTLILLFILIQSLVVLANENQCNPDISQLNKKGFDQHYMNFVNFAYHFKGRCCGQSRVVIKRGQNRVARTEK